MQQATDGANHRLVVLIQLKGMLNPLRPFHKEGNAAIAQEVGGGAVSFLVAWRCRQPGDGPLIFSLQVERRARRDQELDPACLLQQLHHKIAAINDLFNVIQDQKRPFVP